MPISSPSPMTEEAVDLVDRLIRDWLAEVPSLDIDGVAVAGRLSLVGSRMEAEAALALKPYFRNYSEYDIIATLRRSGPPYRLSPGQLLQTIPLTSGGLTAALNRLERCGLIERIASESDRRSKAAQLTSTGIEASEHAARTRFATARKQIQCLDEDERHTLVQLLRKIWIANEFSEESPR